MGQQVHPASQVLDGALPGVTVVILPIKLPFALTHCFLKEDLDSLEVIHVEYYLRIYRMFKNSILVIICFIVQLTDAITANELRKAFEKMNVHVTQQEIDMLLKR